MDSSPATLSRLVERIAEAVDGAVQRIAFAALVIMLLAITAQIIFRVFFDALSWSEEAARYLLVWTTFLGATMAYRRGMHIAVTFAVDAFPPMFRRMFRIAGIAASMVFFLLVLIHATRYLSTQGFQVSASLRIPMPAVYSVMPVTMAIMLLHGTNGILRLLGGREGAGAEAGAGAGAGAGAEAGTMPGTGPGAGEEARP